MGVLVSLIADIRTTGEQTAPNPSDGPAVERGKPGVLPYRDSASQGKLTERRVEEEGSSESRSVMDLIGVAPTTTSPHARAG